MSIGRKYVIPLSLGFVGMFLCHFGLFLFYEAGIKVVAYLFVYPIVYPLLTATLTFAESSLWLTNALFVCAIPFLYWYALLWSDGKLNPNSFSLFESSGMSVIILLALGLSLLVGFVISKMPMSKPTESVILPTNPEYAKLLQPELKAGFYKTQLVLRVLVVLSASIQLLVDLYHYLLPSSQGIPFLWMLPVLMISFFMGPIAAIWLIAEAIQVSRTRSGMQPLIVDTCLVAAWLFVWSGHV
jgi:hypothetical protein